MASAADKELEQQLLEAGNRLSLFPTQVDELLPLLDQVENLLSKVEQSPPKPIQNAYSPSMIALLEEPLLKHSDVDVKVAIASCISEITRITAPEAPYNDDQMKDVFQLIVSSFENLSDKSSRSYFKRASILETVAKVRSCVVMLDLECDGLIVEMFQHFLNSIRDYHPENVFTSMETIMTLVLQESEDVSLELLTTILACVKRDNEEIPMIARKLGEKVFEKCAVKIKPYLAQAVKSLGVSLDDYSKVVASICEGTTGAVEHNDDNVNGEQLAEESKLAFPEAAAQADESKLNTASSNDTAQVAKEDVTEEASLKEVCPEAKTSLKTVTNNGMTDIGNEGTSFIPESSKKPDEYNFSSGSLDVNLTNKVYTDDSDAGKLVKSKSKQEQTVKRRGRKPNSVFNSTEPSDSSRLDSDREAEITCQKMSEKTSPPQKSDSKDSHTSCGEDQHVDTGESSEKEKEHETQISSPKELNSEVVNVAYVSLSESVPDECVPKKAVLVKKKENLAQKDAPSVDPVPAKVADGTSEIKPQRHSEKTKVNLVQEDAPSMFPLFVKVADGTSNLEVKPQRRSRKKRGNFSQEDAPSVDPVSVEVIGRTIDSEVKPQRRSGKKKKNLSQEDAPSVDPVLAKVADGTSDLEVKPLRRSGKKATARITKEEKMVNRGGTPKSEGETTSDSEAKPLRESAKKGGASDLEAKPLKQSSKKSKKGETSRHRGKPLKQSGKKGHDSDTEIKPLGKEDTSNYEDNASSKKNDKKSGGRGKDNGERDLSKSHTKDDDQDLVSSPKLVKDDNDRLEEPKMNSKRKRTPGKDVLLSSFDKVSGNIEYGGNLVGSKVKVWWPKDCAFYEGVIHSFYPDKKRHKVLYTDGDEEILVLRKEKWEFVEDETMQEEANKDSNLDSSSKMHKKKKAKTNSEPLPKQKQTDVSPKRGGAASSSRGGAASSSRSKGTRTKSSYKVDGKVDGKSKDKTSKPTDKSKDNLRGDGKSVDVSRAAIKSKDGGGRVLKTSTKSKQETSKAVTKTKGTTPHSGNKSNGTGKVKCSSSKVKETDNTKGKSSNSGKTPDTIKGKSSEISKAQESEAKRGKKRRRGLKG